MDLRKSLQTINDYVVQGELDDTSLVIANIAYKQKTDFKENSNYKLSKALSLNDFLKTGNCNQDFMKALIPGETKVGKDGRTYIVVQLKSGKLDWRLLKQPKGNNDDKLNDVFDNDDFPASEKDFTIVNKNIGGSTGAVLVEDKNGVKFVMKKGASAAHVEEEFLTNAIYKTMGFDTPDMKLYKENGDTFILSKFIPNTTSFASVLSKGDKLAMKSATDGFVLDCLLANWDVYENDNILLDSNGVPVRVDNGGSLRYRAQGQMKSNFTTSVSELVTMFNHNQWLNNFVTQDDINEQIEDIVKNEKQILDLIDDKNLKSLMKARIVFLKNRLPNKSKKTKKKGSTDKYRELTDEELQTSYDTVNGDLYLRSNTEGWQFLSEICKLRGFSEPPTVLDDDDFDSLLADKDNIYVNRGVESGNGLTAKQCMLGYSEGETCYYGQTGVHGQGIYAAFNKLRKRDKSDPGFHTASVYYAGGQIDNVLDIIIPKEAKTITKKEIRQEMQDEFFGPEFKIKKDEFNEANKKYLQSMKDLDVEKDNIEEETKRRLGWNESTLDYLIFTRPEIVLADTKKNSVQVVLNTLEKITYDINGEWNQVDDVNYEIKLPNSSKKFMFNTHDLDNALKQKNASSSVYNYRIQRFKNFVIENHFEKIKDKINDEIKDALKNNPKLKTLENKIKAEKSQLDVIEKEVNNLRKNGTTPKNQVIGKILKSGSEEMYGIYAAIKGYDVLIAEGGNGDCDYAVILNRSITKVRKFT